MYYSVMIRNFLQSLILLNLFFCSASYAQKQKFDLLKNVEPALEHDRWNLQYETTFQSFNKLSIHTYPGTFEQCPDLEGVYDQCVESIYSSVGESGTALEVAPDQNGIYHSDYELRITQSRDEKNTVLMYSVGPVDESGAEEEDNHFPYFFRDFPNASEGPISVTVNEVIDMAHDGEIGYVSGSCSNQKETDVTLKEGQWPLRESAQGPLLGVKVSSRQTQVMSLSKQGILTIKRTLSSTAFASGPNGTKSWPIPTLNAVLLMTCKKK